MKQLTIFLMILLSVNFSHAQNKAYNSLWKQVEGFENEGLPKSALEIVQNITEKANKDDNKPQLIKSLLFKSKYALILEEDAQLSIINDFKSEIEKSKAPTKNVLENILATMYWQYFQQNRWKFYERTKTSEKVDETDFRTWDLETLFAEIQLHYNNSLQNGLILQQTDLTDYRAILFEQKDSKIFRPTLFDLLAHNALAFYKTDENSISQPAYKFEIDDATYLSDADAFSTLSIASKDTSSLQLQALKIYQDLIKFHLKDANPSALVDVDIERLKFVSQKATFNNKEELFLKTLQTSRNAYNSKPVSALYNFEIAQLWVQQGSHYQPLIKEANQWKLKEAYKLCETVIKRFPKSIGASKCKALQKQILFQTLQITTESYLPIQQDSKLLVRYKNLKNLEFKAYKLTEHQFKKFNKTYRQDEQLKFIKKLDASISWKASLKNEGDYQQHTTEVLVPKLNNGRYLIVATASDTKNAFAVQTIQVTNIALVDKNKNDKQTYQFINRNNGQPIQDIQVKISYKKSYKDSTQNKTLTTNSKGVVEILKNAGRLTQVKIEVSTKGDKAYFGDYYINQTYEIQKNEINYKAFIFTDRSIYRPGQTVHFKGIAIKTENDKSKVLANEDTYALLYNVNGEEIERLELQTNEFGSISGTFILPNNGLTGRFRIKILGKTHTFSNAEISISVEEYKRPKFETEFNPISETFKINDSITVTGNALAFAGSNITDAKVVYRVHRKVQYPTWYYWKRPAFNSNPQEISHGETITNDKGEFEIKFKAIPDNRVDKKGLPVFKYEITADVTDVNGETRSTTTIVNVGYHAMIASITVDDKLDKTQKDQIITIDTKNLNGEFVPEKGTIKIYKLIAPKSVLRERPWAAPDYPMLSKEAFNSKFPYESYANENNVNTWKKGNLVLEKSFDTDKSKTVELGKIKKWQSGKYIIVLESKDSFGQDVKAETKTTLFSDTDKTLADNKLFNITTDKTSYNTNDMVILTIASAAKDVTVTVDIEKNKETVNIYVFHLNNNKQSIEIPVSQEDIGGFAVHYSFAFANSFQSGTQTISVPYPKTDLEIETSTFRDKLQPGTNETWRFKIKGPKGDKVSAELLASMYDASLDQFKSHNWKFNPIYQPTYNAHYRRNSGNSFGTHGFRIQNLHRPSIVNPHQDYDQLNWFGLSLNNADRIRQRYLRQQYLKAKYENAPSSYTSETKTNIEKGQIKGIVLDESGLPLPGVNIIIDGSTTGTQTNFDGNFLIKAKKDNKISLSFLGYKTLEITIGSNNFYNAILIPDYESLDEVVVTAMAIKRKPDELAYSTKIIQVDESETYLRGNFNTSDKRNFKDGDKSSEYYFQSKKALVYAKETDFSGISIRKNLQETAFFFPQLQTDTDGNVSFSFKTPEALTKWKLQLLAHTKTLESTTATFETVTQKELMVIPNAPRFLRQGDEIVISTKIANLTENQLSGLAKLELTDAISGEDISLKLINKSDNSLPLGEMAKPEREFTVDAKGNTQVSWSLTIPNTVDAVQYKVVAKAGDFSDGEQNALPVLSNRILVTETMPMWIRSNETKTFTLEKLKTNTSTTLKHHKLTLEITSNPAWYAVQALPYLMEYPYACNEQTFSRYYANALASHIANSNPRIQEVFNQWRNSDALLSNLEKNQELKNILIQETPWLRDAQSETEQKKRIALLFDLNKMNDELQAALRKLENNQMNSGAWSWFNGGHENRFITQHIITGFGHLQKLNVIKSDSEESMIQKAINYLDAEFVQEYKDLTKYDSKADLSKDHLSHTQLHYLYMRSFFPDVKKSKKVEEISDYYLSQIQKYWLSRSLYSKGLMTLITHRMDDDKTASKILKSLKETSINSEELGMYWKKNTNSWHWYQAPIETQALMIEAFSEVGNVIQSLSTTLKTGSNQNLEDIDNLKIWLLKNKQTNRWKTTKATTEAVYALLLQGSDWLSVTDMVDIVIGNQKIDVSTLENVQVEAGTGYYKTSWSTQEIKPEMAKITLTKKGDGIAWGNLYWQYFEDLDQITSAETPLQVSKKLFLKTNTDTGEVITEITAETQLHVGDLVRVRIKLKSDRNMEFIHMKDMRASGLEPINVLSKYKWQDGLGYYESTKDASTNFFFDYLPKGVYVFEYDLRINNAGNMSNGITTIQSMYAPEFCSHSEGVRISVE